MGKIGSGAFKTLFGCVMFCALASAASRLDSLEHAGRRVDVSVENVADEARATILIEWVTHIIDAARTELGGFALKRARVEIREITSKSQSPVPWGQTLRDAQPVKVLLYVRKGASLAELMADWTAPHELAHLYHPYLGQEGRWLAEGFASYQQHRFMARAGVLSVDDAWRRLDAGFQRGAKSPQSGPLATLSHARGGTMRLYWAGAAYWLTVDLRLRRDRKSSLDTLMAHYLECCMRGEIDGVAPESFIRELDRALGGEPILLPLYQQYADAEAFPSVRNLYEELQLDRIGSELSFRKNPAAQALRRAIMLGKNGAILGPSPKS